MAQAIKGVFTNQIRRLYAGAPRFFCSYNRSLQTQDLTTKYVQSTDFLYNNLKNATNTKTILEMVAQHNSIMNNKHIMQALRSLFTLQRNGNSDLSTNAILDHKDFKKLCRKLRNQAPSIELNETIDALKVVSYVGVPSESTIFQVLLQLIRHNVNYLNLQQIMFLDFLLGQASSSPLVDALKMALPIVFDIHLSAKLDRENPVHVSECLFYASRHNLSIQSVQKIVDALMNLEEFDPKTAKSVVWSICEMDPSEIFKPLMKKAIRNMIVHLDEFTFTELESTLSRLISRVGRKHMYFYDETFFDSCANFVIDKDLGYKQAIYILRKFGRVNFHHKYLLDYMSKAVHNDPELLSSTNAVDIYGIAVAVAMTDYRPVHWDTLKNYIAKSENMVNQDRKEIIWIKFGAALCLLDIYKVDVLSKCLHESFLKQLFSKRRFMSDYENYVTVWQSIKLFRPEFNCLLSPAFDPEILCKNFKNTEDFPMEGALHKALGGDTYVVTDLYSKSGVAIDHALVLRKGGYPVAINNSHKIEFLEDIEVSPETQLVVILGLRHFSYTLNNKRFRDSTNLSIKVLESRGCQVVPVDLELWQTLPDFEKIPYLMRAIKERTFSELNVSESVV